MDQWEFTAIAIALILHLMFLHFPSETRFFLAVKNIDFRKERLQKLLSTTQRIVDIKKIKKITYIWKSGFCDFKTDGHFAFIFCSQLEYLGNNCFSNPLFTLWLLH